MTGSVCGNTVCAGESQGEPILARAGQIHGHMALAQLRSLSFRKLREPSFQNLHIAAEWLHWQFPEANELFSQSCFYKDHKTDDKTPQNF